MSAFALHCPLVTGVLALGVACMLAMHPPALYRANCVSIAVSSLTFVPQKLQAEKTLMKDCCSFETEVKGVMFYEGKDYLQSMSQVYFQRDAGNVHHEKAYAVKLCCNDKMLGHVRYC